VSAGPCEACGGRTARARRDGLVACAGCGIARLEPFPSEDEVRAFYTREYYDAWGMEGDGLEAVRAMKLATFGRRLRELGPSRPGEALLDVGCATGFLLEAARDLGYEPHGVEVSAFAAAESERAFPGRVFQGTLEEARFPEGRFGVVVLSDLLEHVRGPLPFLREVRRVLRPGGRLLIVTPDLGSLSARVMGRRWFHRKAEHLYYFTRESLGGLVGRAGLRPLRASGVRKALSLAYLESQLRAYPKPVLTAALQSLVRLLPRAAARRPLWLPTGEMAFEAERPADR
jgi:SAM-dependent methyltransferase